MMGKTKVITQRYFKPMSNFSLKKPPLLPPHQHTHIRFCPRVITSFQHTSRGKRQQDTLNEHPPPHYPLLSLYLPLPHYITPAISHCGIWICLRYCNWCCCHTHLQIWMHSYFPSKIVTLSIKPDVIRHFKCAKQNKNIDHALNLPASTVWH